MDAIQTAIDHFRLHQHDDDSFIENIDELAEKEGERVYQTALRTLANVDLPTRAARICWQEAMRHRQRLSQAIGRTICLISSLCDFLSTQTEHAYTARLVDASTFARVQHESVIDKLTGLNNRTYFDQVFEQQLSLAKRYNTDLALLFIDIDNFKDVNDRLGHQAGDYALERVAAVIAAEKRDSDIAIRYGGEEFVLLMPHTATSNGLILGERIRRAVAATSLGFEDKCFSVTVSGGLASYPSDGSTTTDILHIADQALYQAKGAGKNLISLFREDKRRYLRVKFNNPVLVKELDINTTPTHHGTGKDICIGGILFNNDEPLEIGSKIQIHTQISQTKNLLLIGTVIRVEACGNNDYDIGIAISFKEMEKIARDEISGLLRATQ